MKIGDKLITRTVGIGLERFVRLTKLSILSLKGALCLILDPADITKTRIESRNFG